MMYGRYLSESFQILRNLSDSLECFKIFLSLPEFLRIRIFGMFCNLSESFGIFSNLSESYGITWNMSFRVFIRKIKKSIGMIWKLSEYFQIFSFGFGMTNGEDMFVTGGIFSSFLYCLHIIL